MVQVGQDGNASVIQQLEMQRVGETPQQNAAKPAFCARKGFRIAAQLFFSGSDDPQKIAAQTVGSFFVPVKGFGNLGLSRRFKNNLPRQIRTPSDCAIWARLLPWLG